MTQPITISASASRRIAELLTGELPNTAFRIAVLGGGCSGFQYHFALDASEPKEDDLLIEQDGARVVVDETSLGLLAGSQLDYSEELVGAAFSLKNPNATAGCGCGNSFAL